MQIPLPCINSYGIGEGVFLIYYQGDILHVLVQIWIPAANMSFLVGAPIPVSQSHCGGALVNRARPSHEPFRLRALVIRKHCHLTICMELNECISISIRQQDSNIYSDIQRRGALSTCNGCAQIITILHRGCFPNVMKILYRRGGGQKLSFLINGRPPIGFVHNPSRNLNIKKSTVMHSKLAAASIQQGRDFPQLWK